MEARLGLNHVLSAARKTACSTEFGSAQRCYVVWGMCRQLGRPMWTKLRFGAEAFPRFLGAKSALAHSTFKVLASGPI